MEDLEASFLAELPTTDQDLDACLKGLIDVSSDDSTLDELSSSDSVFAQILIHLRDVKKKLRDLARSLLDADVAGTSATGNSSDQVCDILSSFFFLHFLLFLAQVY